MPVPTKYSPEEKLIAVQDYLSNKRIAYRIAKDYNVMPQQYFNGLTYMKLSVKKA